MDCTQEQNISLLLTGFTGPTQPLVAELEHMSNQLDRIESGVIRVEGQAAEIAGFVRRMLRMVSSEVTECPRVFTLARERPTLADRARFHQDRYRLTLWCEHSDSWHEWTPASYRLDIQKEWFNRIKPYAMLILGVLQFLIPLTGPIVAAALPPDQLERAQAELEAMKALIEDSSSELHQEEDIKPGDFGAAIGQLTEAEGAGLRALRAILLEHDKLRTFGGMRRMQSPSGDFLWICPRHYTEYDPGLPIVP
jgi:hypothetical protein